MVKEIHDLLIPPTSPTMSLATLFTLITICFTAIMSISAFFEKLFGVEKIGSKFFKGVHTFFTAPFKLGAMMDKINFIDGQLKTNGGSTLKDAVKRLEGVMAEILQTQHEAYDRRMAEYDLNPAPIFINDENNRLVYVNPAWCRMVGCINKEEMLGTGFLRAIPDYDHEEMLAMSARIAKNPVPFTGPVTFKHLQSSNEIRTICTTRPIKSNGKLIETIGIIQILNW